MTEVLVGDRRFAALAGSGMYEAGFEDLLLTHADELFPGFHLCQFKHEVQSEQGSAKADFALVDKQYRRWWVVEVELGHHSLERHVYPQVAKLATATYDEEAAKYLVAHDNELDLVELREMMMGDPPEVLVLVNEAVPAWHSLLDALNVGILVIRPFRADRNELALLVEGEPPSIDEDEISICRPDPVVPRFLRVESPGGLPGEADALLPIRVGGQMTTWKRMNSADTVWLCPEGTNPFSPNTVIRLVRRDDQSLELVPGA